jgi:hypothetical protein
MSFYKSGFRRIVNANRANSGRAKNLAINEKADDLSRTNIQTAVNLNTAKTGITTSQASAITANTAKTGITSTQAGHITANNAKVTYDKNLTDTNEMNVRCTVAEVRGVYTLTFTVVHDRVVKTANITMS